MCVFYYFYFLLDKIDAYLALIEQCLLCLIGGDVGVISIWLFDLFWLLVDNTLRLWTIFAEHRTFLSNVTETVWAWPKSPLNCKKKIKELNEHNHQGKWPNLSIILFSQIMYGEIFWCLEILELGSCFPCYYQLPLLRFFELYWEMSYFGGRLFIR